MKLTVLTVLYGGLGVLKQTLPTWRACAGEDVEFIFVDHSPTPLDQDLKVSSWGRYFWNPENPGFAAGVNFGVRESSSEKILLLNPDVFLEGTALGTIAKFETLGLGAVGLRTRGQVHRGIEYSWWGFCRDRRTTGKAAIGPSGGGAVFDRTEFLRVGPFPEHLFAWGEDAEWALIAFTCGLRTHDLPVTLEHVGGHSVASTEGQKFKARLLVRNRVATFRRVLSRNLKLALFVPFALALVGNFFRKVSQRTAGAYARGVAEGLTMQLPDPHTPPIGIREWRMICGRGR